MVFLALMFGPDVQVTFNTFIKLKLLCRRSGIFSFTMEIGFVFDAITFPDLSPIEVIPIVYMVEFISMVFAWLQAIAGVSFVTVIVGFSFMVVIATRIAFAATNTIAIGMIIQSSASCWTHYSLYMNGPLMDSLKCLFFSKVPS